MICCLYLGLCSVDDRMILSDELKRVCVGVANFLIGVFPIKFCSEHHPDKFQEITVHE